MIRTITPRPTFQKGEILRLCPKISEGYYDRPNYQSIRIEILEDGGDCGVGIIKESNHHLWKVSDFVRWLKKYYALLPKETL